VRSGGDVAEFKSIHNIIDLFVELTKPAVGERSLIRVPQDILTKLAGRAILHAAPEIFEGLKSVHVEMPNCTARVPILMLKGKRHHDNRFYAKLAGYRCCRSK